MSCLGKTCTVQHRNRDCRGGKNQSDLLVMQKCVHDLAHELGVTKALLAVEVIASHEARLEVEMLRRYGGHGCIMRAEAALHAIKNSVEPEKELTVCECECTCNPCEHSDTTPALNRDWCHDCLSWIYESDEAD